MNRARASDPWSDGDAPRRFEAERFGGEVGALFRRHHVELLHRWLAPWRPGPVVDVGAGSGRVASALGAAGWETLALDRSLAMTRHVWDAGVPSAQADGLHLPLGDRSVAVAVALRLLMHLDDWDGLVGELCRVARGAVVVDFPPLASPLVSLAVLRLIVAHHPGRHDYRVLSARRVRRALGRRGFEVVASDRQLALPFGLHRALALPRVTAAIEGALRRTGITSRLGAPLCMLAVRAR